MKVKLIRDQKDSSKESDKYWRQGKKKNQQTENRHSYRRERKGTKQMLPTINQENFIISYMYIWLQEKEKACVLLGKEY